jgi:hypothetical protein
MVRENRRRKEIVKFFMTGLYKVSFNASEDRTRIKISYFYPDYLNPNTY